MPKYFFNHKDVSMRFIYLVLSTIVLVYCFPLALHSLSLYDEAIRIIGAEQVLKGYIPYIDFYAIYAPGEFIFPALFFKVLGTQVVVFRLWSVLCHLLNVFAIFCVIRSARLNQKIAFLSVFLYLLIFSVYFNKLYLGNPSIGFLLLACITPSLVQHKVRGPLIRGILVGVAGIFRHGFGAYGLVAILLSLLFENHEKCYPQRFNFRKILSQGGWVIIGAAIIWLPTYGMLLLMDFQKVIQNLVIIPKSLAPYRGLPIPWDKMAYYLANAVGISGNTIFNMKFESFSIDLVKNIIMVLFGMLNSLIRAITLILPFMAPVGAVCVFSIYRLRIPEELKKSGISLFLVGSGLALYGFVRCDEAHVIPVCIVWGTLTVLVVSHLFNISFKGNGSKFFKWVFYPVVLCVVFFTMVAYGVLFQSHRVDLPKTKYIRVSTKNEKKWYQNAVEDIHKANPGLKPIFVGSTFHDRIYTNDILLYFLSGYQPGTYWYQFDPGLTNTKTVQKAIVSDLMKRDVKTVYLGRNSFRRESNLSKESSGVFMLDYFFNKYFEVYKRTPDYYVLTRVSKVSGDPNEKK